jgi:hypothetical protein
VVVPTGDIVPPAPAVAEIVKVSEEVNVAPTLLFAFIVRVQVLVPEQSPVHPVKVEPVDGVAVKVTEVPELKEVPVGLFEIEPEPVPEGEMESVYVDRGTALKVAAMVWFPDTLLKVWELTAPIEDPSTVTLLIEYPVLAVIV